MKEFDLFEIYDDTVLEVCGSCLRIRILSELWMLPEESVLVFFFINQERANHYIMPQLS